jgi:hypothetical protein
MRTSVRNEHTSNAPFFRRNDFDNSTLVTPTFYPIHVRFKVLEFLHGRFEYRYPALRQKVIFRIQVAFIVGTG